MSWGSFFWGVGAFLFVSFVANLFDPDFREAALRFVAGLFLGPFFLLALTADKYLPAARWVSPAALERFAQANVGTSAWVMAYRKNGVLVVRGGPRKEVRP